MMWLLLIVVAADAAPLSRARIPTVTRVSMPLAPATPGVLPLTPNVSAAPAAGISPALPSLPVVAAAPAAAPAPSGEVQSAHSGALFDGLVRSAAEVEAPASAQMAIKDLGGAGMQQALGAVASLPVGGSIELGFEPTLASLRALSRLEGFEALLLRHRGGGWLLVKGGTGHAPVPKGDFDVYAHNHYYHPVYAKSFVPYPSDGDLLLSAGRDARFFVVSQSGLAEWSPAIPYEPADRGRLTDAERARRFDPATDSPQRWRQRFLFGTTGRIVLQWTLATAVYGRLLKASGVDFVLYPWSDKRLDAGFLSGPGLGR